MTIKCAWAAIDEHGNARGGQKGDQTGREVHTGPWYDFGQNCIIRPKNKDLADKLATVMEALANNDAVGYDQSKRLTLYRELAALDFNYKKLKTKCATDCSAMVAASLNVCGVKVSPNLWTGNLWACVKPSGKFTRLSDTYYLRTGDYLKRGDIILNEQTHVIVALEDGIQVAYRESRFTTSGIIAPKSLVKGERFTIGGTVKSNAQLVAVEAGVQDVKGNWQKGAHAVRSVTGFSYNLLHMDEEVRFRKLAAGTYYYRVFALDKNKTQKRVVNRKFTVVAQRAKKSYKAIAQEIYTGKCSLDGYKTWGTGATRKARLKEAGYTADEIKKIQAIVDELMGAK